MRTYDFAERLAWSEGIADSDADLLIILRARIPGCVAVERASLIDDRTGTDYWAHRAHGLRPLSIDLKARSVDPIDAYGTDDVALETWSSVDDRPGWTRDPKKTTDYILWLWTPTRRFFLVPFPALCKVFERYWEEWAAAYPVWDQRNDGWMSQCVMVPRSVLIDALGRWMGGVVS